MLVPSALMPAFRGVAAFGVRDAVAWQDVAVSPRVAPYKLASDELKFRRGDVP